MAVWSTDVQHLVAADDDSAPAAARKRSAFTRALVEAATSQPGAPAWTTSVRCVARAGRKVCGAPIAVKYDGGDGVAWSCAACGENGTIHGFRDGPHDLSFTVDTGEHVTWGLRADEYELLLAATAAEPERRGIVVRARPHSNLPGVLLVRATTAELDDLYTLVEELGDTARGRRQVELLGALRFSLATAMDGV